MNILGLPSGSSNSFYMLFIHSVFLLRSFGFQVSIFYGQIVLFLFHPVVDLSLCNFHRLVDGIFFRYLGKSYFVCIVWPFLRIFWVSLLSPISFDLFLQVTLSYLSAIFFSVILFHCVPILSLVVEFLCKFFLSTFPSRFCISVLVPFGDANFITE